ncbi:UDP-glucosyltransferase 2-like [Anticarsia gemmatalis]|uniref:UDP-glucosyltransferase 2-like n=1 Tax=Anticarsia gemmatalis TaxID=129554 RepID=UPI003F762B91
MLYRSVVLLCALVQLCVCGRVLVVFPMPGRSHTTLGDAVVKSLLKGGHNVTYVTTYTEINNENVRVINVSPKGEQYDPDGERPRLSELLQRSLPSHHELTTGAKYAVRALRHDDLQQLMRDKLVTFDVVVAEWFYSALLAPLAAVFDCPLVWYSSVDACWQSLQLVHEAPSPAYAVDLQASAASSQVPSVSERAHRIWRQTYLTAWQYYMTNYIESPLYYEQYQLALQRRGSSPPLYEDLIYSGSLLLINSQPALGQNLALPTSAKYVGVHHIGRVEPLPKELQTIFDGAKSGVIYVNLGSTINAELPEETARQLLKVFRQLEQVVLWKYGGALDHVPANVHVVDSVPQKAILKHPKTVLMISHAGYLSYTEAMFFGVPLIGVPVFGDQLLTMDLLVSRGRGLKVHYTDKLAAKIQLAVDEVLGNTTYQKNAKEASFILHQQLVPPSHELRYWVELVMSTRGAPHLRSPAIHLNMMERYHVDVIALLFLLYWFFTKVAKVIKVYWGDFGTDCGDDKEKNE